MNLIKPNPNPNYHFVLVAGALKYGRPAGRKPDSETPQFQLIKNVWENIEDLEDVDLMSDQVLRTKMKSIKNAGLKFMAECPQSYQKKLKM